MGIGQKRWEALEGLVSLVWTALQLYVLSLDSEKLPQADNVGNVVEPESLQNQSAQNAGLLL